MPMTHAITHRLAIRGSTANANANHHLWNNHGSWWCHYTLQAPGGSAKRIRHSLKTADLEQARARRDRILQALSHTCVFLAA